MIPEEVARIADILLENFEWGDDVDAEAARCHAVDVAWEIYRKFLHKD